jgi:hypothetical protein
MPRGQPPKYDPLRAYLAAQVDDTVMLTVAEIETIVGTSLPARARSGAFWANAAHWWDASPQARAWLEVGWRVTGYNVRLAVPTVTFGRTASTAEPVAPSA